MKSIVLFFALWSLPFTVLSQCYDVQQIPYSPLLINGTQFHNVTGDGLSSIVNIGFPFCFFGDTVTQCLISSNGYITFDISCPQCYSPWGIVGPIPSSSLPDFAIMAPFQDLGSDNNNAISSVTTGFAPNRKFVIKYESIPLYGCQSEIFSNQIILYESSNIIDINIENKPICPSWGGGQAIEGIHNQDGTEAYVVPGRNSPSQWTAQFDSYRFVPVCECSAGPLPGMGIVPGKVFWDQNGNCELDPNELPLPNIQVDISPAQGFAWTNQIGQFALMMDPGNYNFEHSLNNPPFFINECQSTGVPVLVIEDSISTEVFFADSIIPISDLSSTISTNAINACFTNSQVVQVCNYGTIPVTDVSLSVEIPEFTGASNPEFTATSDSTWLLNIPVLNAGQCLNYYFQGQANCDSSMIGQVACMSSSVTSSQIDADSSNNDMSFCDSVGVSYDPNDIRVLSQQGTEGWRYQEFIDDDDVLTYMVRFQNTGTGPAYNVIVRNQLSDFLNHNSIEILASSHSNFAQMIDGELAVQFLGIELPDSASDPTGSQGYFIYRIHQTFGNPVGTVIENQADIYFDFNAPVATNITENEILLVTDIDEQSNEDEFILYPNPTTGQFSIVSRKAKRTIQSVRVYDPSGRLVLIDNDNVIDVSQIESGIYFVEIEAESRTQVKRLLKN